MPVREGRIQIVLEKAECYICKQQAHFRFNNGNCCCKKSWHYCPEFRKKASEINEGHVSGNKGKKGQIPWNKNRRPDLGQLCQCGCGRWTNQNSKYIHGHNGKGDEERSKRISETLKRKYADGSRESWNKDLTKETDERIKGQSEKLIGRLGPNAGKRGPETSMWGRKRPEHAKLMREQNPFHDPIKGKERKEKLSKSCIEKWKNPSYREKYMGANNSAWQGGKSFEPYGEEFNEELKEKIRNRDRRVCQFCDRSEFEAFKQYRDRLNVHHIDYKKSNNDPMNLISLCRGCHSKTGSDREFWQKYFTRMMMERDQKICKQGNLTA